MEAVVYLMWRVLIGRAGRDWETDGLGIKGSREPTQEGWQTLKWCRLGRDRCDELHRPDVVWVGWERNIGLWRNKVDWWPQTWGCFQKKTNA